MEKKYVNMKTKKNILVLIMFFAAVLGYCGGCYVESRSVIANSCGHQIHVGAVEKQEMGELVAEDCDLCPSPKKCVYRLVRITTKTLGNYQRIRIVYCDGCSPTVTVCAGTFTKVSGGVTETKRFFQECM